MSMSGRSSAAIEGFDVSIVRVDFKSSGDVTTATATFCGGGTNFGEPSCGVTGGSRSRPRTTSESVGSPMSSSFSRTRSRISSAERICMARCASVRKYGLPLSPVMSQWHEPNRSGSCCICFTPRRNSITFAFAAARASRARSQAVCVANCGVA
jgi:hypothetical protein